MKKLLIAFGCALLAMTANAQDFVKGDNVLGVNIGFGGHAHKYGYKMKYDCAMIPLMVFYERCVADNLIDGNASIGVGANMSYGTRGDSYTLDGEKWKSRMNCLDLAAFCNFHYQFVDKLDTYVGLQVGGGTGLWKVTHKVDGVKVKGNGSSADAVVGAYIGAKYYLTDAISLCGELGGGLHTSVFKLGVAARF